MEKNKHNSIASIECILEQKLDECISKNSNKEKKESLCNFLDYLIVLKMLIDKYDEKICEKLIKL